jgi:glycosyltransferase involved in cell wall biosynthesis
MKVLLVITHGNIGGATNVVIDLANGLKSRGVDVAVGSGAGEYLDGKLKESGVPHFYFKNIKRSRNPFAILFFIFEIRRFVKKEGFDIVQFNSSNSLPGALGVKLANKNIKTVFTVHGLSILDKNYKTFFLLKSVYYLFFKFFLRFTDAAVFVSKNNLDEAKGMGLVKDGHIVYNGLATSDLVFLEKNEARAAIEEKINAKLADKFLIGSIGRLSYQKNYEFLIKSFPDVLRVNDRAVCVVIGDGPKRTACENLIKKLNLKDKVFLAGELRDGSKYLKAFDLFVLPSRYEGLPVTLAECSFADVPVLVSNVGGNGEIATGKSLYELDDEAGFTHKLAAAFEEPKSFLCDTSKKELFALEKMSEGYRELFKNLVR